MTLLDIKNLIRRFRSPSASEVTVVDVPSFSLEESREVALRGESGAGKTTFLNLIAGILAADEGRIQIDGQEMATRDESARDRLRASTIGYVFQTFNLLQGYSALENVELAMMLGRGVDRDYARQLLERVGLADRLQYRPGHLSVGQQQRVAIARAMANRPKLVLADEPTGNLDARNAANSLELLRELCESTGAALLIVSHDENVLARFDDRRDFAEINRAAAGAEVVT